MIVLKKKFKLKRRDFLCDCQVRESKFLASGAGSRISEGCVVSMVGLDA
jgi:hypothetical protein